MASWNMVTPPKQPDSCAKATTHFRWNILKWICTSERMFPGIKVLTFWFLMQKIQSHRRAKVPLPTLRQLCKGHQRHSLFFVVNISVDLQFWWNNISKNINLTLDGKHPFCHLMLRQHVPSAVGQSCKLQRPLSHHFEIMSRWSRVFSALQLQCI